MRAPFTRLMVCRTCGADAQGELCEQCKSPAAESAYRDLKSAIPARLYRDVMGLQVDFRETVTKQYRKRPAWHYRRDDKRLRKMLTKRYLPAIEEVREVLSADELRALRCRLEERLSRGLETEGGEELFQRLVDEYEVVWDAGASSALGAKLSRLAVRDHRLASA